MTERKERPHLSKTVEQAARQIVEQTEQALALAETAEGIGNGDTVDVMYNGVLTPP